MLGVIDNVIGNVVIRFIVSDDVVVVIGLPGEIDVHFAGIGGYRRFISTDYGCQIFGLWTKFIF